MTLEEALAKIDKLEDRVRSMVPKERLDSKSETIRKLETERDEALAALKDAPDPAKLAKREERLQAKLDEVQAQYEGDKRQWATSQALVAAGITDPDDQDLVLHRHGKLGDGAPDLSEWLSADDGAAGDKIVGRILDLGKGPAEGERQTTQRPKANNGTQNRVATGGSSRETFHAKPAAYRVSAEGRAEFAAIEAAEGE